jgi:hypothetical protein
VQPAEDLLVAGSELAALGDGAFGGAQGDQVQACEFVAGVAPGVGEYDLDHPDDEQGEPAQLDVGLDAFVLVVEHRAQVDGGLVSRNPRSAS